jgi:membrane-associated phospholipid phosphatase
MLFPLSQTVSGQFVTMAGTEAASRWGKMSLFGDPSAGEFRPRRILALPKLDTLGQSGGSSNLSLFGNFGNNIVESFEGKNIYLHLAAIASTALLVTTDVDYHVEDFFHEQSEYGKWARPVLYTGELLPFAAGGGLFAYAKVRNDNQALGASFAVLQASLIEFMYNSALKAVTGRPNPAWWYDGDMEGLSKTFRFGFLRGGIFWGWPSGHTATTMAVVSALTNYYPDKTWLKIAGYSWVAYTMFGVSSVNRGGMHWFSDAVAGALMSYAVGSTVGKYYLRVYNSRNSSGASATNHTTQESIPLGTISIEF